VRTTITVPEISERLGICEESVYDMLRSGTIPNIRYGRRFIMSRVAYERWEGTIGEAIPRPVAVEAKSEASDRAVSSKARSAKAA
jgi:excisionase family DNA binding protein